MTAEDNKRIARAFIEEIWNEQDLSAADRYISPNLTPEGPFAEQFPSGPEGSKMFTKTFLAAFPDTHATVEDQEVEGEWVRTWITFRGTQTGQLMDIPATGRSATVSVLSIDRVVNGKIVESRTEWDPEDMFRQLGVG
jgi:predicted ester cyclase